PQRQVELRSRLLVGDKNVALAATGGATGDGSAVDQGDVVPVPRQEVRTGRPDDAGADHDDAVAGTHRHPLVWRSVSGPIRPAEHVHTLLRPAAGRITSPTASR